MLIHVATIPYISESLDSKEPRLYNYMSES